MTWRSFFIIDSQSSICIQIPRLKSPFISALKRMTNKRGSKSILEVVTLGRVGFQVTEYYYSYLTTWLFTVQGLQTKSYIKKNIEIGRIFCYKGIGTMIKLSPYRFVNCRDLSIKWLQNNWGLSLWYYQARKQHIQMFLVFCKLIVTDYCEKLFGSTHHSDVLYLLTSSVWMRFLHVFELVVMLGSTHASWKILLTKNLLLHYLLIRYLSNKE